MHPNRMLRSDFCPKNFRSDPETCKKHTIFKSDMQEISLRSWLSETAGCPPGVSGWALSRTPRHRALRHLNGDKSGTPSFTRRQIRHGLKGFEGNSCARRGPRPSSFCPVSSGATLAQTHVRASPALSDMTRDDPFCLILSCFEAANRPPTGESDSASAWDPYYSGVMILGDWGTVISKCWL
jgi:hypothetical protein